MNNIGNVYIGFECVYDGDCTTIRDVAHVFANESDAMVWCDQKPTTESEWREYDEYGVE